MRLFIKGIHLLTGLVLSFPFFIISVIAAGIAVLGFLPLIVFLTGITADEFPVEGCITGILIFGSIIWLVGTLSAIEWR